MALSMSVTQVQAQVSFGTIQVQNINGNRSGISGTAVIAYIDPTSVVELSCIISSTGGREPTLLLQRSSGGGVIPFFCPFIGAIPNAPPPNGPTYYWVIIQANISNPCGEGPSCYNATHTLITTGNPVYII